MTQIAGCCVAVRTHQEHSSTRPLPSILPHHVEPRGVPQLPEPGDGTRDDAPGPATSPVGGTRRARSPRRPQGPVPRLHRCVNQSREQTQLPPHDRGRGEGRRGHRVPPTARPARAFPGPRGGHAALPRRLNKGGGGAVGRCGEWRRLGGWAGLVRFPELEAGGEGAERVLGGSRLPAACGAGRTRGSAWSGGCGLPPFLLRFLPSFRARRRWPFTRTLLRRLAGDEQPPQPAGTEYGVSRCTWGRSDLGSGDPMSPSALGAPPGRAWGGGACGVGVKALRTC